MQPPRSRTPRINLRSTKLLRSLILNATAVLVTILIARLATLLVAGSGDPLVPRTIEELTDPIAWPFRQIPVLDIRIAREVLVADLFIIVLVSLLGLAAAGIVTGWRESSSRKVYDSNPFG